MIAYAHMVRKISKRAIFGLSMILSSVMGFFVTSTHSKGELADLTASLLDNPIASIETAYAQGDSGDCSGCSCDGGGVTFPSSASGLVLGATKI
jgi:hypothetical protein